MSKTIDRRVCAEMDGEFVVFLIGMRINKPWKFWRWMQVAAAMPRMLIELAKQPELGLLHVRSHFGPRNIVAIQYWRSYQHLEDYARKRDSEHLPAWQAFNRTIGSNGDVGIWHETYLVAPGTYEAFYNNMPPFGLGAVATLVDAKAARNAARGRIKATVSGGNG